MSADKNEIGKDTDQNDALRENIPLACFICKGPYKNPVVTSCDHCFCEPCALKSTRKILAARLAEPEKVVYLTQPG